MIDLACAIVVANCDEISDDRVEANAVRRLLLVSAQGGQSLGLLILEDGRGGLLRHQQVVDVDATRV